MKHKGGAKKMQSNYLTVTEASEIARKSPRTIRNWIKKGKFEAYQFEREYNISESSFNEFVSNSKVIPMGTQEEENND